MIIIDDNDDVVNERKVQLFLIHSGWQVVRKWSGKMNINYKIDDYVMIFTLQAHSTVVQDGVTKGQLISKAIFHGFPTKFFTLFVLVSKMG